MSTPTNLIPSYAIDQRIAGYADNDGRYVVQRVAPLYWSRIGTLRQWGMGRFVGVFDTLVEAETAVTDDLAVWETEIKQDRAIR